MRHNKIILLVPVQHVFTHVHVCYNTSIYIHIYATNCGQTLTNWQKNASTLVFHEISGLVDRSTHGIAREIETSPNPVRKGRFGGRSVVVRSE